MTSKSFAHVSNTQMNPNRDDATVNANIDRVRHPNGEDKRTKKNGIREGQH